jgi:hypothetical protein
MTTHRADDRTAAAAEVAALRRPFLMGIAAVLVLMVALGALIRQANAGNDRPEGAAERWLAAVGDTTRKGVAGDATKRAEELGGLEPAKDLLPPGGSTATDGKVAFPDLEVGGATDATGKGKPGIVLKRVPYRLHRRIAGGKTELREGVAILQELGGHWRVTQLDVASPSEKVPSEGGRIPSRAPIGAFAGAVLLGALVTVGAAGLIRWAGR